ncbi:MAG: cell division protein SepF [Lachnospiraceae bacterium]|nr:cell division protein SepF [Lachnospiraceae bacterium]
MSVIDKFLNVMKMNDDVLEEEFLDDPEEEEDYDEPEEVRPKKRIKKKAKDRGSDFDLGAQEADRAGQIAREEAAPAQSQSVKQSRQRSTTRSSKISPMRTGSSMGRRSGSMEVCVIKPKNIEDSREVTETLLDECTVILNMEGIDFELAQRIIDFACGSCYAIHGKLQKVSNYIFIITPPNVDISGDFQEMVGTSYDVPSFGTSF